MKNNKNCSDTEESVIETEEEKGLNDCKKENLCLFYSLSEQLQNVFVNYKCLKILTVIGQSVESLEGVEELANLEELWLVESNLQQECVDPLGKCVALKRLYLYSNQLTAIPYLGGLERLTHLWLSDNNIDSLQNLNNLLSVHELYLCNNNIVKIDIKFKTSLKIGCLNLSGNPISNFKEIEKLTPLRKLRWLILNDPLYRCSPVYLLANYRPHIMHVLPDLERLDSVVITAADRNRNMVFYETKLQFYRLTLHNSLARLWAAQGAALDSQRIELEDIWSALRNHGPPPSDKTAVEQNSNFRFWEGESHRWKERKQLCLQEHEKLSEIITQQIQLELEHSGNLRFEEVSLESSSLQEQLKEKFDSFICPKLKEKVVGVSLVNVWAVHGPHRTTVLQSGFKDSWHDVCILNPVQDLNTSLLRLTEDLLFDDQVDRELTVSRCLAAADSLVTDSVSVHRQLLLRSQAIFSSRLLLLCGLLAEPLSTTDQVCYSPHHCCPAPIPHPVSLVPLYLVHFKYVFQDYYEPLRMSVAKARLLARPPAEPLSTTQHVTKLVKLVLTNANIEHLDIAVMEHVTSLDLSYNLLQDLSKIGSSFPRLTYLNLAFNRVHTLDTLLNTKNLVQLVLKWNFLSDFLITLKKMKEMSSLKQVDLSWNPFIDVLCSDHEMFLVCRHLNSLHCYNGQPLPRSLTKGHVTLKAQDQFPIVPGWKGSTQPLTVSWKAELSSAAGENHLGVVGNKLVSVRLRGLRLTQFRSVFSLSHVKWLDLSGNLFSGATALKSLVALEEVTLSGNVLESLACAHERFRYLVRLDLSHNYLTSLADLSWQSFPQLKLLDLSNNRLQSLVGVSGCKTLQELYLCHNLLQDCHTLVCVQSCRDLRVLDLSHNPLRLTESFRQICLYYLNSLKYINGTQVRSGEVKSAMVLYGGLLDNDYLTRVYTGPMLANLTHLSLPNCSIKRILLPDVTLLHVTSVTLDHNKICCLSWVQAFPKLASLSLSHNRVCGYHDPSATTASPPPTTTLHALYLDHNHVQALPPLKLDLFPNLTTLVINDNEISSLTGLKNKPFLERLVLDRNRLSSISAEQAGKLTGLRELFLERNALSKLDFLRPLKRLRKLFLGYNKLVTRLSLTPLSELVELQELTLYGNPVGRRASQCLPALPALRMLEGHPLPPPPAQSS